MPRLIDADRIDRNVVKVYDYKDQKWVNIFDIPTVDAVEVVRCKDCRFHEREQPGMVWCPCVVGSWMAEDGFCSMGEREEDGQ